MPQLSNKTKKVLAAVLIIGAGLAALIWWLVGYKYDTWNVAVRAVTRKFFVREMFPSVNPLHWTPFTYFVLAILFAACIFFALKRFEMPNARKESDSRYGRSYYEPRGEWVNRTSVLSRVIAGGLALASVLSLGYFVTGLVNNDKDEANSYLGTTVYDVADPANMPSSLLPLVQGGHLTPAGSKCLYTTVHDVTSCIQQGTLPDNWDARNASQTGAGIVMSRTSGAVPNTDIMDETLTYLYSQDGSGVWSAIRNGKSQEPLNGIVTWDGTNPTQTCRFSGKYALNKAFGGQWGQNLDDTLASEYPGLLYIHDDMWGYCKGDGDITQREPVIVVPVSQQESYGRRTTMRPAGVLIITGSPSGSPVITHEENVKAGELPGPVYPISMVAAQRDALQWSAGRGDKKRLSFGYEPSNVASQAGNDSEYLLRDAKTGRLFWVTPLTPRSSSSQLLIAYSVTPADEVQKGELNTQHVYVLADNDARIANMDDMEARVSQALRTQNPGFFTGDNPGKISEFLPINSTTWQAFAELNGRVVSRIDVPVDSRITPTVTNLDSSATAPTGPSTCTKAPKDLSKAELSDCIAQFAKELASR